MPQARSALSLCGDMGAQGKGRECVLELSSGLSLKLEVRGGALSSRMRGRGAESQLWGPRESSGQHRSSTPPIPPTSSEAVTRLLVSAPPGPWLICASPHPLDKPLGDTAQVYGMGLEVGWVPHDSAMAHLFLSRVGKPCSRVC